MMKILYNQLVMIWINLLLDVTNLIKIKKIKNFLSIQPKDVK
jgi:hypothetical protein